MKRKINFLRCGGSKFIFLATFLWLTIAAEAFAQTPLSNLVFAVGTTITATNGQNWSYFVIGSEMPALLAGKQFAVYGKNGYSTNAGTFSLRGKIFQQTSTTAINLLLNQSVVLRDDLTSLSNALNVVLHNIPSAASQTLPQKLATAFQLANSDPNMNSTLTLLGRNHPGVLLGSGQAFSEPINAVTTYEIREVNPANGDAGDVIGRVTVVPGSPVVLPAPGFPFQLPSPGMAFRDSANNPAERIKIYLRWGTPPELRRLSLLNYGFNVWRMDKTTAEQNNFNVTPPTLAQLYANATQANDGPVMATKDFSATLPNDPSDLTTFFFVDDNGRKYGMPLFVDGAQYYYFITARDLLGRDGFVSAGTRATACRQLAPAAPTGLKVKNILQSVVVSGVATNQPRFQLNWKQNTDTNDNVTEYWIYLWDNPSMVFTNDVAPLNHRIGVVAQQPGTNVNSFVDSGNNLPTAPSVSNYWFTVRAVSQATCGPLLSPQSAPAWGVLRERQGPDATTGQVYGSCGTPVVTFQNFNTVNAPATTNNLTYLFRLTCQRRDPTIQWVIFTLDGLSNSIGPVYFPPDGNNVSFDVSAPVTFNASGIGTNMATCMVGDFDDNVAQAATNYFITPQSATTNLEPEADFYAGELLLTALSSSDPLLAALNSGPVVFDPASAVTPYPEGTVSLKFSSGAIPGQPRLIQVLSNSVWTDVSVAWPDTNNVYWVSYPACLIGPLPSFRGGVINVPNNGGCPQHLSGTGGGGSIAPILISFQLTVRTREYRLYCRADDGPSSLIAQGPATFDPANAARAIVIPDDVMPPTAAHLCYYVQLLDEHGNGSPLALLGCRYQQARTAPRPVLAELKSVGDTNHPQVLLSWFCPTSGVHRFQINITREDKTASGQPSGLYATNLLLPILLGAPPIYLGLKPIKSQAVSVDETQFTPPVGPNFGPGPQFSLTANVVSNDTYTISVTSMDDTDAKLATSDAQTFTWQQTNTNVLTVPWPARPLPAVTHFDDDTGSTNHRVSAVLMGYQYYGLFFSDTIYPVGIRIGDYVGANTIALGSPGTDTNGVYYNNFVNLGFSSSNSAAAYAIQQKTFHRHSSNPARNGEALLPIVVYRQQVANAQFPKVTGALVQVSPLIEKIPWAVKLTPYGWFGIVPDLLFASGGSPFNAITAGPYLFLRDQQPVVIGASYQYYVVRFNAEHEVAETIDAGIVTIPSNSSNN
jgi:hypothetical protein